MIIQSKVSLDYRPPAGVATRRRPDHRHLIYSTSRTPNDERSVPGLQHKTTATTGGRLQNHKGPKLWRKLPAYTNELSKTDKKLRSAQGAGASPNAPLYATEFSHLVLSQFPHSPTSPASKQVESSVVSDQQCTYCSSLVSHYQGVQSHDQHHA